MAPKETTPTKKTMVPEEKNSEKIALEKKHKALIQHIEGWNFKITLGTMIVFALLVGANLHGLCLPAPPEKFGRFDQYFAVGLFSLCLLWQLKLALGYYKRKK